MATEISCGGFRKVYGRGAKASEAVGWDQTSSYELNARELDQR